MMDSDADSGLDDFLASHKPVAKPEILSVGATVGEWRVTAFLGRGGSSEVYRVVRGDGTAAALKVLMKVDDTAGRRFLQEMSLFAVNALSVLPKFYGHGEVNGRTYFVCEQLLPVELPHDDAGVARYLLDVCRAVGVLHGVGLIHRDLKPSNIMKRENGEIVLIDLGLVKDLISNAEPETGLSIVSKKVIAMGTPAFAAPEQMQGGRISTVTDIHAIGRIAYALLGDGASSAWIDVIRKATSSIAEIRYQSVEELALGIRRRHARRNFQWICVAVSSAIAALAVVLGGRVAHIPENEDLQPVSVWKALDGGNSNAVWKPMSVGDVFPRAVLSLDDIVDVDAKSIPVLKTNRGRRRSTSAIVNENVEMKPSALPSKIFRQSVIVPVPFPEFAQRSAQNVLPAPNVRNRKEPDAPQVFGCSQKTDTAHFVEGTAVTEMKPAVLPLEMFKHVARLPVPFPDFVRGVGQNELPVPAVVNPKKPDAPPAFGRSRKAGTTYFVDCAAGSDANDGLYANAPKRTIQAAVDAAAAGDTILVAPGEYAPISTHNKPLVIRATEGLAATVIDGACRRRCADLGERLGETNTVLVGFTILRGRTDDNPGAGVRCGRLRDCRVMGCTNSFGIYHSEGGGAWGTHAEDCEFANNSATHGGGLMKGSATRCVIRDNYARDDGGGAHSCTLLNCLLSGNVSRNCGGGGSGAAFSNGTCVNVTIAGNRAQGGGGVIAGRSALYNCILHGNTASRGEIISRGGGGRTMLEHVVECDPHFVDAEHGDYRLAADSPCIDVGDNARVPGDEDLAGNPRIVNGTVDVGCYEYAP